MVDTKTVHLQQDAFRDVSSSFAFDFAVNFWQFSEIPLVVPLQLWSSFEMFQKRSMAGFISRRTSITINCNKILALQLSYLLQVTRFSALSKVTELPILFNVSS